VLSLPLLELARADITNMAQVSYLDAAAFPHRAASNIVTVISSTTTSPGPDSLPAPDLSGINGKTYSVQDPIAITYTETVTGFIWSLTPLSAWAPALRSWVVSPIAGYTTAAPQLGLASFSLNTGVYQITVQAEDGNILSPSATATITLVVGDLGAVRTYPNPWRADKDAGIKVTFSQLTGDATVKVFDLAGRLIKDLGSANGTTTWDLTNTSGEPVASGLYLYLVTNDSGQMTRGKLAIIR